MWVVGAFMTLNFVLYDV